MSAEFAAIAKGRQFNLAAPGANVDIFSADLAPIAPGPGAGKATAFRVTVCLAVAGVFRAHIENGATNMSCALNGGVALAAGTLYTFSFGVRNGDTVNFQLGTDGIVRILYVDEVVTEAL